MLPRFLVLLAALSVSQTAWAQEEPEALPPQPPAAASTNEAAVPIANAPEEGSRRRVTEFGIGPALVFWSPPPGESSYDVSGALALHNRNAFLLGGILGFSWSNDVVFHDWKAMGDAYSWYFDNERPENESARALKFTALWPGLLLIPFGGANYTSGVALAIYFLPSVPTVYMDMGANFTLFLRLSDPDFRADFAIGAHGALGVDFTKRLGLSARVLWGAPVVHTFIDGGARHVITTSLNGKLMF